LTSEIPLTICGSC